MTTTSPRPLPKLPPPTPLARPAVKFGTIQKAAGHRVVLYGPGGIGKTTLAAQCPGPVAFFDLDDSLPRLKLENSPHVVPCESWQDIRTALQSDGWDDIKTIVIDSATKAEELALAHTLQTVKHEKGNTVSSVEGYGFGKGYQHVFDTFLPLLGDLERHTKAGRNVVMICHDCTCSVPNPAGDDWIRYEPRLQSPKSGNGSIRLRVREWVDHMLFIGYDVAVDRDGKGKGSGTRTVYTAELPHCMAKSRTTQDQLPISDSPIWETILR